MHNMPGLPVGEFAVPARPGHGRLRRVHDRDHRPRRPRRAAAQRHRPGASPAARSCWRCSRSSSRNADPLKPVVVSVTIFRTSSNATNVIPERVELRGTARSLDPEVRDLIEARTPARSRPNRRIVEADGGTLLLDEVGALPPETQATLDRVLATGEVRPVGCNGSQLGRRAGHRHRQPPARRRFRSRPRRADLRRPPSPCPPLRDRSGDIPALARHLLGALRRASRACARCRSAMTRWRC